MQAFVQHELKDKDIICTQDKSLRNHAGNLFFRDFVDRMLPAYKAAENKREKMNITRNMIDALHETHGYRFVRFDEETASWVEANAMAAREKVGHALRNAMRKEHKKSLKRIKTTRSKFAQSAVTASAASALATPNYADVQFAPISAMHLTSVGMDVSVTVTPTERPDRESRFSGLFRSLSQGMLDLIDNDVAVTLNEPTPRAERTNRFSGLFRSLSQGMLDLIDNDTAIGDPVKPASSSDVEQSGFNGTFLRNMFRSISQGFRDTMDPDTQHVTQGEPPDLSSTRRFSGMVDLFRSLSGALRAESTAASRRSTIGDDCEPLSLTAARSVSHGVASELVGLISSSDPHTATQTSNMILGNRGSSDPHMRAPTLNMMESTNYSSDPGEPNGFISLACEANYLTLDPAQANMFVRSWLEGGKTEV